MGLFVEDDFDETTAAQKVPEQDLYSLDFNTVPVDYKKYSLFFSLHFIYYNIMGPFIAIFFLFTRRSRMLMYNMHIVR
jgi:hypothetical protein